jgi:UDP-MurNAc hydroxylase
MLTFLGHAGFMYETENEILLMDPWMSNTGAFDSSWYQFPSNHLLGDDVRKLIETTDKKVYIYISHEHKDHFDVPFLQTLELSKVNFITPKFRRDHVASVLNKLGPKSVYTPIDSELVNIGNLEIRLFLDDQEIVRDSALGLYDKDSDFTFLNLNDCKVYDRVDELFEIYKKFNIFTCQFSGAVFHPVCYDYPEKKYYEISESKVYGKFGSVKNLIAKFKPELYIPAAGPPVFLDPQLISINYQDVNIFSSPFKFKKYLQDALPALNVEVSVPGSRFHFDDKNISIQHPEENIEALYDKKNIEHYAMKYDYVFSDREKQKATYEPLDVQKRLLVELNSKLKNFNIQQKMNILMEFSLKEIEDTSIYIDFESREIDIFKKSKKSSDLTYEISSSAGDVGRLLDGYLNWEDFMLSFRHKLKRTPDIYQVAVNGFLTMEKEDVPKFVDNLMRLQNQRERITVEVGGVLYSIDKFCPHQGSDLTTHEVEDDRFLICPKHRWSFDLEDEGRAVGHDASINAIDLDGDGS